jgi:NAD-dependent deacetylase
MRERAESMMDLDRVAAAIKGARRVTALTGAGVSAASGIPTFRGPAGLWKTFKPETLATPSAFARDPRLVWECYDWRRQLIKDARPNAAHDVLAEWSRERSGFSLITQNVDGLHEVSGAANLIRLHGSIWELKCWAPCRQGASPWRDDTTPFADLPPRCPHCLALARPAVVWFGEGLDPQVTTAAERAAACDVFLSVGTSAIVYPAAGLLHHATAHGALTVEINPDATEASGVVDVALRGAAEEILPALAGAVDRAQR